MGSSIIFFFTKIMFSVFSFRHFSHISTYRCPSLARSRHLALNVNVRFSTFQCLSNSYGRCKLDLVPRTSRLPLEAIRVGVAIRILFVLLCYLCFFSFFVFFLLLLLFCFCFFCFFFGLFVLFCMCVFF